MLATLEQQNNAPRCYWVSISHWGMIAVTFYQWLNIPAADVEDFR